VARDFRFGRSGGKKGASPRKGTEDQGARPRTSSAILLDGRAASRLLGPEGEMAGEETRGEPGKGEKGEAGQEGRGGPHGEGTFDKHFQRGKESTPIGGRKDGTPH